jgi:DNA-binding HxlR family transcriptional regulator
MRLGYLQEITMRNYDVYSQNCPTRLLLDHIADKWAALIPQKARNRTDPLQ